METKYIDVDGRWGVIVCYNYDEEDKQDMWSIMRSFNMTSQSANRAINILSNYNTGMAVSNDDIRMSAIFISKATSPSQFWDTLNHELYHVCTAIIDYYDEPYDQEGAAHLQGFLMRKAVELIGEPCK